MMACHQSPAVVGVGVVRVFRPINLQLQLREREACAVRRGNKKRRSVVESVTLGSLVPVVLMVVLIVVVEEEEEGDGDGVVGIR